MKRGLIWVALFLMVVAAGALTMRGCQDPPVRPEAVDSSAVDTVLDPEPVLVDEDTTSVAPEDSTEGE